LIVDQFADFDLRALYDAIVGQRERRGLTWRQTMDEISLRRSAGHLIAQSTVVSLRVRAVVEGDGVLQMLRWLGRAPESFVPGLEVTPRHALPEIPPGQLLRFDTRMLYAALDGQRLERGLSWQQAAREIGGTRISAGSLTHLRKGGRTAFPGVVRMARWLGRPTGQFTRGSTV
jgi:hypothetical protein